MFIAALFGNNLNFSQQKYGVINFGIDTSWNTICQIKILYKNKMFSIELG